VTVGLVDRAEAIEAHDRDHLRVAAEQRLPEPIEEERAVR